jgi:hypothetical protein
MDVFITQNVSFEESLVNIMSYVRFSKNRLYKKLSILRMIEKQYLSE